VAKKEGIKGEASQLMIIDWIPAAGGGIDGKSTHTTREKEG